MRICGMKAIKAVSYILTLAIIVILAGCDSFDLYNYPHAPATPAIHHVVSEAVNIEPKWVTEEVFIHLNDQDAAMESAAGKTCFLGNLGERKKYYDHLVCLESNSGDLLWDKASGVHDEIAVTSNGIFVTYIGPASLKKYDFQNGNLMWQTSNFNGKMGASYLYIQDDKIEVLFLDEMTATLNFDGEVVQTVDGESVLVSKQDEVVIDDGLQPQKTGAKGVLWKYKNVIIYSAPLFTKNKIFVNNDFTKNEFALDRNTGTLLWEIPKILGNFAYSSNRKVVYALRENGELLSIDEDSGKEMVIAKFSAAPFVYTDGVDDCGYYLSYDEKEHMLFVYIGDSRQLFAFSED